MVDSQETLSSAIQLFPREDHTISFWDHPNFKSRVALPDDYFAITRVEQGLEMLHQGRINEDALMVMKVIGDAMCANENQLRRYLSKKITPSQTSGHITRLRKYGFVERHLCRLAFIEEDGEEFIKPPAPFTLGIAGYKLLNHLYSKQTFMRPDYWREQPLSIQRYVAINEFRCLAVETGVLKGWAWNPYIGGSPKHMRPMGVAKMEAPQGELQLLLDRPQMSQNFIGYLRTKMEQYRNHFEKDKFLLIDGFSRNALQIVCLYVSSVSMARFIQEEVRLHTYPFDVWFLVDEWIEDKGLSGAFASVTAEGIKRIRVPLFDKIPLS